MTIRESVTEINKMFKEENDVSLSEKVKMLEKNLEETMKIIENLAERLNYLESR